MTATATSDFATDNGTNDLARYPRWRGERDTGQASWTFDDASSSSNEGERAGDKGVHEDVLVKEKTELRKICSD